MDKYIETKEEALQRVREANKHDYCKMFNFAEIWIKSQFKVFNADDLRKAYLEAGNQMPQQRNIIGSLFNNLSKEGLIFFHSFSTSKTPESKGHVLRNWISREFKMKQQSNASNKNNLKLEL